MINGCFPSLIEIVVHWVQICGRNFHMYELTKIMRQRDDKEFLNRLREGKHKADDLNVFEMHVIGDNAELYKPNLYITRKEINMYNTRVFDTAQRYKN